MNDLENLVYRISGHESSSSASSTLSRPISGHESSPGAIATTGIHPPELLKSETPRKTEYIEILAPVTSADEMAYLRPEYKDKVK